MKDQSKSKIRRRLFSINQEIGDIDFNLSKITGINAPIEIDILCLFHPAVIPSDWSPISVFVDADILSEALKIQKNRLVMQRENCFKLLGEKRYGHGEE